MNELRRINAMTAHELRERIVASPDWSKDQFYLAPLNDDGEIPRVGDVVVAFLSAEPVQATLICMGVEIVTFQMHPNELTSPLDAAFVLLHFPYNSCMLRLDRPGQVQVLFGSMSNTEKRRELIRLKTVFLVGSRLVRFQYSAVGVMPLRPSHAL